MERTIPSTRYIITTASFERIVFVGEDRPSNSRPIVSNSVSRGSPGDITEWNTSFWRQRYAGLSSIPARYSHSRLQGSTFSFSWSLDPFWCLADARWAPRRRRRRSAVALYSGWLYALAENKLSLFQKLLKKVHSTTRSSQRERNRFDNLARLPRVITRADASFHPPLSATLPIVQLLRSNSSIIYVSLNTASSIILYRIIQFPPRKFSKGFPSSMFRIVESITVKWANFSFIVIQPLTLG